MDWLLMTQPLKTSNWWFYLICLLAHLILMSPYNIRSYKIWSSLQSTCWPSTCDPDSKPEANITICVQTHPTSDLSSPETACSKGWWNTWTFKVLQRDTWRFQQQVSSLNDNLNPFFQLATAIPQSSWWGLNLHNFYSIHESSLVYQDFTKIAQLLTFYTFLVYQRCLPGEKKNFLRSWENPRCLSQLLLHQPLRFQALLFLRQVLRQLRLENQADHRWRKKKSILDGNGQDDSWHYEDESWEESLG